MSATNNTDLTDHSKGDIVTAMLEHVGYDRQIGEGANGEMHVAHYRALIKHCRKRLPAAELSADDTAFDIDPQSSDLECCSAVELRLLISEIAGAEFKDRVYVDERGKYRAEEGHTSMLRQDEIAKVYRIVMNTAPAESRGEVYV